MPNPLELMPKSDLDRTVWLTGHACGVTLCLEIIAEHLVRNPHIASDLAELSHEIMRRRAHHLDPVREQIFAPVASVVAS